MHPKVGSMEDMDINVLKTLRESYCVQAPRPGRWGPCLGAPVLRHMGKQGKKGWQAATGPGPMTWLPFVNFDVNFESNGNDSALAGNSCIFLELCPLEPGFFLWRFFFMSAWHFHLDPSFSSDKHTFCFEPLSTTSLELPNSAEPFFRKTDWNKKLSNFGAWHL